MSLYERPRRLQSIRKAFRLLCEAEIDVGADEVGADVGVSDVGGCAVVMGASVFAIV